MGVSTGHFAMHLHTAPSAFSAFSNSFANLESAVFDEKERVILRPVRVAVRGFVAFTSRSQSSCVGFQPPCEES